MKKHSKAYEQYCWVKQKNVVLEETVYHNGTRTLRCTLINDCRKDGGCRNSVLEHLWDKQLPFVSCQEKTDNR